MRSLIFSILSRSFILHCLICYSDWLATLRPLQHYCGCLCTSLLRFPPELPIIFLFTVYVVLCKKNVQICPQGTNHLRTHHVTSSWGVCKCGYLTLNTVKQEWRIICSMNYSCFPWMFLINWFLKRKCENCLVPTFP